MYTLISVVLLWRKRSRLMSWEEVSRVGKRRLLSGVREWRIILKRETYKRILVHFCISFISQ